MASAADVLSLDRLKRELGTPRRSPTMTRC